MLHRAPSLSIASVPRSDSPAPAHALILNPRPLILRFGMTIMLQGFEPPPESAQLRRRRGPANSAIANAP
jgi:hypothetical protein